MKHLLTLIARLFGRNQRGEVNMGDILQKLNGRDIKIQRDLFEALDELRPGETITLTISRDGTQKDIPLTLGGREGLPID